MEVVKALTTKDVLDFFANAAAEKITLFIFFAIIMVILVATRKNRKEFTDSCKSLQAEISKVSNVVEKNTTADEEKDKKYMAEFRHLNDNVSNLSTNITQMRTDVVKIHNYCMGKNGYTGGAHNDP